MEEVIGFTLEAARTARDWLAAEGAERVVAAGLFAFRQTIPVPVDVASDE